MVAEAFYGVALPPDRAKEIHLRSIEEMLDRALSLDDGPLTVPRPADKRLTGRCRHFALLLVGLLRAQGVAARVRCGFAGYFNPPYWEDHWVSEVWQPEQERWVLVDPQLDEIWRAKLNLQDDPLDLPPDRFLVAGEAWDRCRNGTVDPAMFGIGFARLRGLWFVAASLVRDTAALNKVEMLPWDIWGAMPRPNRALAGDEVAFFDRLAGLTRERDAPTAELRALFEGDGRIGVPATVYNAILERSEPVFGLAA
jgi:hypothetical protein